MWSYIARRVIQAVIVLLINTVLIFTLTRLSSDPMAQYANRPGLNQSDKDRIRHNLGLDQPLPVQYLKWLQLAVKGDLGISLFSKQPVWEMIIQRLPMTLILMLSAEFVIVILSLLLGMVAAIKQYSLVDTLITSFSFIGYSLPIFFVGLSLMLIFAVKFKEWGLPFLPTGADIWDRNNPVEMLRHLALPVATLTIIQVAGYSRFLRSSILEVLGQDYVRTARAKGVRERLVLFRHAFRNALIPIVTIIGLQTGSLLSGAVLTETVFSLPGIGSVLVQGILARDYPVVQGFTVVIAIIFVLVNLVVDLSYAYLDPRIRLQ